MKVKELIRKLQDFDQEKEVIILYCDENPLEDAGRGINKIFEINGIDENTDCVWIQEL